MRYSSFLLFGVALLLFFLVGFARKFLDRLLDGVEIGDHLLPFVERQADALLARFAFTSVVHVILTNIDTNLVLELGHS